MSSTRPTDFQQLIASARAGDRDAQTEILSSCRHYLLYIAGSELDERLRQKFGPSDIVQNTMMHASEAFSNFEGDTEVALRAWLRQILSNELATVFRLYLSASKRDVRREVPRASGAFWPEPSDEPVDPLQTPASEAIYQEEIVALRSALQGLSEEYREVLMLRNWQRLSFAEIADRMQRSESAVKKLWARAFMRLEGEMRVANEHD